MSDFLRRIFDNNERDIVRYRKIAEQVNALESDAKRDELQQFGRMLAMHIAATNPVALDLAGVPPETLARERAILEEKNSGKPANVLEKIIASGLKSYAKENCLLEQGYVRDPKVTVGSLLSGLGAEAKVNRFIRVKVGEE